MIKITAIVFVTMIVFVSPASALLVSATDAWQFTNIATISSTPTIHPNSNVSNMFGTTLGSADTESTVFNDYSAQDYWHTVQWTLTSAITLGSFNLVAAHDGTGYPYYRDQNYRGFSAFKLEYLDSSGWNVLYASPKIGITAFLGDRLEHPVYGGGPNYSNNWIYEFYTTVTPTTAATWKISFQQFGAANYHASGPRIVELDGYVYENGTPVPEPSTMLLLGAGLVGLAGYGRKAFKK